MEIRKVRKSDNKQLAELIRNVFDEMNVPKEGSVYSDPTTNHLFELFHAKKTILWVATENRTILGCCGIFPTVGLPDGYAELVKLYLTPKARGKGIGKTLFEKSILSAKEFGFKTLYIESFPNFSTAINLYKKYGFTTISHPLGNSGHTSCNIWMVKNLE